MVDRIAHDIAWNEFFCSSIKYSPIKGWNVRNTSPIDKCSLYTGLLAVGLFTVVGTDCIP